MSDTFLEKNDYEEPCCPFTKPERIERVPISRIIKKLDEYLDKDDYKSAESHLIYWLADARQLHDRRGELSILNEQVGLYRKCGKETECLLAATLALKAVEETGLGDTITAATTYINVATGYKAFGKAEMALPFYEQAKKIYETNLEMNDPRLGGLYNNMALALTDLDMTDKAEELYEKALKIMMSAENGGLEAAITYCNLADLTAKKLGMEQGEKKIFKYLDKAIELLERDCYPKNGYYAFVCKKCAPTFGYYGYFSAEKSLMEKAERIYEKS